jgi:hypothetical protein
MRDDEPNPHNLPIGDNGKPWPRLTYAVNYPDGGWIELTEAEARAFKRNPRRFFLREFGYDIPQPTRTCKRT